MLISAANTQSAVTPKTQRTCYSFTSFSNPTTGVQNRYNTTEYAFSEAYFGPVKLVTASTIQPQRNFQNVRKNELCAINVSSRDRPLKIGHTTTPTRIAESSMETVVSCRTLQEPCWSNTAARKLDRNLEDRSILSPNQGV